jgi:hypothetical protein
VKRESDSALASAPEIRFVALRNRMEIVIEVIVHVLGANDLRRGERDPAY